MVSGLTFKSLIHFEFNFCECCKIGVHFHCLTCEYPIIPALFIEEIVFSPLSILGSLSNMLTVYALVYFWALDSVPLVYLSVFMPVPYCFNDCIFIVQLEIREYDTSFFLLSQDFFGYSGSLWSFVFPHKFQDCFFTSVKNTIGILIEMVLNLWMTFGNIDILTI